ncbi:MAG TPA: prolyl oligopeptidase family serine peptidase, partial [Chthoniobacterales bacterium]|nr:prolyl oligopeptidase family serine peptidase [Chthoniobacterales bacterium]
WFSATSILAEPLVYPPMKHSDVVDDYFGTKVPDPYRWLEDIDSPEVVSWTKAENELARSYLEKLPDRAYFRDRLTRLAKLEWYSIPSWTGSRYFYFRHEGLENHAVLYTIKELGEEPRVAIDPNEFSTEGTVALATLGASHDGKLLAYGVSAKGSDWNEIRVRDLESGKDLADALKWAKFSALSWTNDSKGFFYSRFPEPKPTENRTFAYLRDQKVYYHRIGDPQEKDQLIYECSNHPDWLCSAIVSIDGTDLFLIVTEGGAGRNQLYFKDLGDPLAPKLEAPFIAIVDQFEARFWPIEKVGKRLFVRTDKDAPKNKLISIDLENPGRESWKEILPESKNVLQTVGLAGGKLAVTYSVDATDRLQIYDLEGKFEKEIQLPALGAISGLDWAPERPQFFYAFSSFLYPYVIFGYNVNTGEQEIFKKIDLTFPLQDYETKQLFYQSKDGTKIPMFIVHKKGIKLDGSHPVFLTGYGGFNMPMKPAFDAGCIAWVERGGVFAVPNLRGGGEYGQEWHQSGTKERKQNVFDDFIAAAETLIKDGYTKPEKVAIQGGSNGGILIGAVLTQRPDLFGAAVCHAGVLDMLRHHKFTGGSFASTEYGSADNQEDFKYLFRYSPLQNVKQGISYPPTLITTGDHDDRVFPAHSFKFTAALQEAQASDRPILLRIEADTGHGQGMPLSKLLYMDADVFAFMWDNVN